MEIFNTVGNFHLWLSFLLYISISFMSVVAMDLCEFEELSMGKSGFNSCAMNMRYEVQMEAPIVSIITAAESTMVVQESTSHTTEAAKTYQQSTFSRMAASESTTGLRGSTQPTSEVTTTSQCGPNMEYTTCTCRGSCQDPDSCTNICTNVIMCICADGFLINGTDCVAPEQCGCYLEEVGILLEGQFYVNIDCTKRAVCTKDQLSWDENYACSPNATCDTKYNVHQCYCDAGYIGDGLLCSLPSDCLDLYDAGYTNSDVHYIKLTTESFSTPFKVYCDMSDGGGWTVFQRRENGSVDFYRDWDSYKQGFGSLAGEFWLGNEKLHHLTNQKRYAIKVDLINTYGNYYYARYDSFRISDEGDNYRFIEIGSYTGTADTKEHPFPAGYAFSFHLNKEFSTFDRDNDMDNGNCAEHNRGAWWYAYCHYSNLNGYYHADLCAVDDIDWTWLPESRCNLRSTQMKLRPY